MDSGFPPEFILAKAGTGMIRYYQVQTLKLQPSAFIHQSVTKLDRTISIKESVIMELHIGEPAPEFTLADQNGKPHSLSDYLGKWVLIYFYPKDDTPGCTKEACAIKDAFPNFKKINAVILGISTDSVQSHAKFAKKYDLPFTLLSNEDKSVVQLYGVWSNGTKRTSFLIDPDGFIAKIYENVKPEKHAEEVLQDLNKLTAI